MKNFYPLILFVIVLNWYDVLSLYSKYRYHHHQHSILPSSTSKCTRNNNNNGIQQQLTSRIITSLNTVFTLNDYLLDSEKLGTVRFVVVGSGAILETVGSYSNLRYSESVKGKLATISWENPYPFECHLRINEIKTIKHIEIDKFGNRLYIARYLDSNQSTILSSILHDVNAEKIQSW